MSPEPNQLIEVRNKIWQLAGFLAVVAVIVFGTTLASRFSTSTTNEEEIKETVREIIKTEKVFVGKPSCKNTFDEFLALKEKKQFELLVNNKNSYAAKSGKSFIGDTDATVRISGEHDIACGYLYIKVSRNNQPINHVDESVYINPQEFGGHVLIDRGILSRDTENYTEALIPLTSVGYDPGIPFNPDSQDNRIANWAQLLNVNTHVKFMIGLSTVDYRGKINEIGIAYKCWNSETGEETQNCQLAKE